MLPGSHQRALRAAIRLALAGVSVHGCTRSSTPAQPPPDPASTPRVPDGLEQASAAEIPPAPLDCQAVLDAAFPAPRDYEPQPNKIVLTDSAVAECCVQGTVDRSTASHRWDCCYATVDPALKLDRSAVQAAEESTHCMPWGPPCPPPMSWRGRPASSRTWALDLQTQATAFEVALAPSPDLETLRPAAIATWRGRMVNEYRSASVFEGLAAQFERLGFGPYAERLRGFADDERRHGAQCAAVVRAFGGEARAKDDPPAPLPEHPDADSELEAAMRNLLSICCLSETVAVALISAEAWQMPAGPLRELLDRILADEVGHARFGWRVLDEIASALDEATRVRLSQYLRVAFSHLVTHELDHLPVHAPTPPSGELYGLCDGRDARALFHQVVRDAIIPGLEARGLGAAHAWARRPLA